MVGAALLDQAKAATPSQVVLRVRGLQIQPFGIMDILIFYLVTNGNLPRVQQVLTFGMPLIKERRTWLPTQEMRVSWFQQ